MVQLSAKVPRVEMKLENESCRPIIMLVWQYTMYRHVHNSRRTVCRSVTCAWPFKCSIYCSVTHGT